LVGTARGAIRSRQRDDSTSIDFAMMTSSEIRQSFLDFFKSKEHIYRAVGEPPA
jgi:hypothetical protein